MTVNHAILGILSYHAMSGYDLKKIMQDSVFMYWSGNNNQIYTALVDLLKDGLVTNEIHYQDSLPSKKVYTITKEGMDALKEWTLSAPLPMEMKKPFLIQLAWADMLDSDQLDAMLAGYENEMNLSLIMNREMIRRGNSFTPRTPRETFLWKMIDSSILSSCQNELDWIRDFRRQMKEIRTKEGKEKMNVQIVENAAIRYLEVFTCENPVASTQDALDLVALCGENDTSRMMLHREALSDDFFKLKTGVAGEIFQKFINYSIQTAVIIPETSSLGSSFRELISEANRGGHYRFFPTREEAEIWFLKGK